MKRRSAVAPWLLLLPLAGCIPSNVVAVDDRMVEAAVDTLAFAPGGDAPPLGLWASVEITGDAAVSLRKVYYLFAADGSYTAAALVDGDGGPAFQTLSGRWRLEAAGLALDDAPPVPLERAPGHLRLRAPTGAVVLRQERAP